VAHPAYREGRTYTSFIQEYLTPWRPKETPIDPQLLIAAAAAEFLEAERITLRPGGGEARGGDPFSPWDRLGRWRG